MLPHQFQLLKYNTWIQQQLAPRSWREFYDRESPREERGAAGGDFEF